jgi:hypothetical protein
MLTTWAQPYLLVNSLLSQQGGEQFSVEQGFSAPSCLAC